MSDQFNLYIPIEIHTDLVTVLAMIGTIQLACRHPAFIGPTRELIEEVARKMQKDVSKYLPATQNTVIEMGWNPEMDIER